VSAGGAHRRLRLLIGGLRSSAGCTLTVRHAPHGKVASSKALLTDLLILEADSLNAVLGRASVRDFLALITLRDLQIDEIASFAAKAVDPAHQTLPDPKKHAAIQRLIKQLARFSLDILDEIPAPAHSA